MRFQWWAAGVFFFIKPYTTVPGYILRSRENVWSQSGVTFLRRSSVFAGKRILCVAVRVILCKEVFFFFHVVFAFSRASVAAAAAIILKRLSRADRPRSRSNYHFNGNIKRPIFFPPLFCSGFLFKLEEKKKLEMRRRVYFHILLRIP